MGGAEFTSYDAEPLIGSFLSRDKWVGGGQGLETTSNLCHISRCECERTRRKIFTFDQSCLCWETTFWMLDLLWHCRCICGGNRYNDSWSRGPNVAVNGVANALTRRKNVFRAKFCHLTRII